ncbi:hypothetical protein HY640_03500 [Candidatus Woesearchaeota archaeon]|nr:hypothetical protein [Candidatus Woesearchaeota archaeon]
MLATIIFVSALIVYFRVSSNISDIDERALGEVSSDSAAISESLMGIGYPSGWTAADVQKVGFTDGDFFLNQTKVNEAALVNYSSLKAILGVRSDFFVFFEDRAGNVINLGVCGVGKLAVSNISPELCSNVSVYARRLARTERLVYSGGVVKMVVYAWKA